MRDKGKTRLSRKDYDGTNSYYYLEVKAIDKIWDTEGKELKFIYNNDINKLTIFGNVTAIYVHYIPYN